MANMRQYKTYYGTKGESGEREPKGAAAADRGQKKVGVPIADREKAPEGLSGERSPAGAKARDSSGERKEKLEGGVGQGKADALTGRTGSHAGKHDGRTGEFNAGKQESVVYRHKRGQMGFTYKG
jgi:hypothetical protein